jgi:nitronate monooxygenase
VNKPLLRTILCDILEIEYPIILAGMGNASGPELAAAVSNAGGLGVLGAAALDRDELASWIERTRRLTSKPFGVDTLLPSGVPTEGAVRASRADLPKEHFEFARNFKEKYKVPDPRPRKGITFSQDFFKNQIEVIMDLKVPVYASGLGNPSYLVKDAHARGMKVMGVAGNTKHVRRMREGGIDVIVAQGTDGGGHNSRIGTMALIPQSVDAAASTPLVAAGGIGDGRGLAAALALGACGIWCGSIFLGTKEANIPEYQKQVLVRSGEDDTIVSKALSGKPLRHIKNRWTEEFEASGLEALPMPFQGMVSGPITASASENSMVDVYNGIAGQIVGLITEIRPASEIVEKMVKQCVRILSTDLKERVSVG